MSPDMVKKGSGWGEPRKMIPTPTASDHIERNSTSSEAVNPLTGKSVSLDRFVKFWPDEETQQSGQPRMWATPTAAISQGTTRPPTKGGGSRDLRQDVRMWPTPDVRGFTNQGALEMLSQKLNSNQEFDGMTHRAGRKKKSKMWPTPTARDYKDNGSSPAELARNSVTLATHAGGSLNPQWVEWLMGYPEGWTDLKG
tara:strand:- start:131 stop:721 length:591 start_codon:yes stop_codon:yes gene_type:complete